MNRRRSVRMPSSNGIVTEAASASTHASGAGRFFALAATLLRANCRKASAFGCCTVTSRSLLHGRSRVDAARASAIAASSGGPSTTPSKSDVDSRSRARSVVPLTIMFSAPSSPIARGSRCVPPAPGMRPSFTSGSAMAAEASATR
jgi:hypothetical protein